MGREEERARVNCFVAEGGEMEREEEGGRVMSISWGMRKCNHVAPAAYGGGGGAAGVGLSKRPKTEAGPEAAVVTGDCVMAVPCKEAEKKKKKKVRVRLSQERIDKMLSITSLTKPFPVPSEKFLARIKDPVERENYRAMMARAADLVYKSRERVKQEQDYVREELATLGYVEREVEVTDDEEEGGEN